MEITVDSDRGVVLYNTLYSDVYFNNWFFDYFNVVLIFIYKKKIKVTLIPKVDRKSIDQFLTGNVDKAMMDFNKFKKDNKDKKLKRIDRFGIDPDAFKK